MHHMLPIFHEVPVARFVRLQFINLGFQCGHCSGIEPLSCRTAASKSIDAVQEMLRFGFEIDGRGDNSTGAIPTKYPSEFAGYIEGERMRPVLSVLHFEGVRVLLNSGLFAHVGSS